MKIAFISSEVSPFSKTGGLGDVSGSLPKELSILKNDVRVFTPKYSSINSSLFEIREERRLGELSIRLLEENYTAKILRALLPESATEIYLIDCPHFFHRSSIYTDDPDEGERFIFFSKAVIETIIRLNWEPEIIHCNDWQTGLIPAIIGENHKSNNLFKNTKFIFTIHNIAFQGNFKSSIIKKVGLNEDLVQPMGPLEFYDKLSFLKAGIIYSDIITTVSETYARELLTKELGAGMNDLLEERREDFYGIINGVDYKVWNPETDQNIPFQYSIKNLALKQKNKSYLQKLMRLPEKEKSPLIGFIARLTDQKGFDIITESLEKLLKLKAQWIFLGTGDSKYETFLKEMRKEYPEKVAVHIGFDSYLAHLIEAGSDIFLMPSRFEPCGLNQIYSLKYGTVPIVRKTGGLADTVIDWTEHSSKGNNSGTGFVFEEYSADALQDAVCRAIRLFNRKDTWLRIQKNGMTSDFSIKKSAEKYLEIYNKTISGKSVA